MLFCLLFSAVLCCSLRSTRAPPYYGSKLAPNCTNHCPLIDDNEEYHYNSIGWHILAAAVRKQFLALLVQGPRAVVPADGWGRGYAGSATSPETCPDGVTSCPAGTSCAADTNADTRWGCCMVSASTSCNDGFHCCGAGTVCQANGTNPISKQKPMPLEYSHVCTPA